MGKSLIDYVTACYELEKSIYIQLKIVEYLQGQLDYFTNYKNRYCDYFNTERTTIPADFQLANTLVDGPNYRRGLYTSCSPLIGNFATERPHSPEEVIIYLKATKNLKYGFFDSDRKKAQKRLTLYREALAAENEKIEAHNKEIREISTKKAALIKKELESEVRQLDETKDILNSYYHKNIVFAKYRNLVAISAILEYLMSGRCNSLPEAYNKFEEEARQSIIINNLEIIIDELDTIKRNQYMLYEVIASSSQELTSITHGIGQALRDFISIDTNSAIRTYNNKICANNQKYRDEITAFDMVH